MWFIGRCNFFSKYITFHLFICRWVGHFVTSVRIFFALYQPSHFSKKFFYANYIFFPRKSRVLERFPNERSDHDDVMDDVKEVINGIDQRLGVHINIVSENLGKMSNMVEEVRNAILDPAEEEDNINEPMEDRGEPGLDAKTIMWLNGLSGPLLPKKNYTASGNVVLNSNKHKRRSKFDRLLTSIYPLSVVRN